MLILWQRKSSIETEEFSSLHDLPAASCQEIFEAKARRELRRLALT